jgi:hypothetical protein
MTFDPTFDAAGHGFEKRDGEELFASRDTEQAEKFWSVSIPHRAFSNWSR